MSYISQSFRLFLVSNLSVRNFRICLLMYPGSLRVGCSMNGRASLSGLGLSGSGRVQVRIVWVVSDLGPVGSCPGPVSG